MFHQRNSTLDLIKLFAAYMVVFIHVNFPGLFGSSVTALARFAVPLFFVASGFCSYQITTDRIKQRILHILRLIFLSVLIYTLYKVSIFILKSDFVGLYQHFRDFLNIKSILKLLAFNIPFHATYLWYLFAILYTYFVFYIITANKIKDRPVFMISFVLLAVHLLLGEGLSIFGIRIKNVFVRNFVLMGIPFFGIGLFAAKYQKKLAMIPRLAIILCMAGGIVAVLLSRFLIGPNELYLGSVFILFAFILAIIKFEAVQYPRIVTLLANCSTYVYILHTMISPVVKRIYLLAGIDYQSLAWLHVIHPLLICLISTVLAYWLNKLAQKIHI